MTSATSAPGRPSTTSRLRGRRLQRIRTEYFALHPLCEHCEQNGKVRLATELDHRIALDNGGKDFNEDPSQKQGLCADCHAIKTSTDLGHKPVGGDAQGMPTDPRHPWNQ